MKTENLKVEVLHKFKILQDKLTDEEKFAFHFKSLSNFIHHIFNNQDFSIQNTNLKRINLNRNQLMILSYLNDILNSKASIEDSEILFKERISPIGAYMSENFRFILAGGRIKYLYLLSNISIGVIIDVVLSILFHKLFFGALLFFFLYSIFRVLLKQRNLRIYGPNY